MHKDLRIDVKVPMTGGDAVTVACYFDPYNPIPIDAYMSFLVAGSDEKDETEAHATKRRALAFAGVFDAACKRIVVGEDEQLPPERLSFLAKTDAINQVLAMWSSEGKAPGQSSTAS